MRTTIIFCVTLLIVATFGLFEADISRFIHNEVMSSLFVPFFIFVFFLMDISEAFFGTRSFHRNLTHFSQNGNPNVSK
jgi:hypothetical protein